MKVAKLIQMIEEYYGKYERSTVRKIVYAYLTHYSEKHLDQIYQRLILAYSGQYKFTPDVAILKNIIDNIEETEWLSLDKKILLPGEINEKQHEEIEGILDKLVKRFK